MPAELLRRDREMQCMKKLIPVTIGTIDNNSLKYFTNIISLNRFAID
jgi:hypothetical protein